MLNGAVSSELIRWIPLLPLAGAAIQATTLFVLRRPVRRTWVVAMSVVPLILSFLGRGGVFGGGGDVKVGTWR